MIGKMFNTARHQRFSYRPRYYNPKKEEINKLKDNASRAKEGEREAIKERISRRLDTYNHRKDSYKSSMLKSNILLLMIVIVLALLVFGLVTYMPGLLK